MINAICWAQLLWMIYISMIVSALGWASTNLFLGTISESLILIWSWITYIFVNTCFSDVGLGIYTKTKSFRWRTLQLYQLFTLSQPLELSQKSLSWIKVYNLLLGRFFSISSLSFSLMLGPISFFYRLKLHVPYYWTKQSHRETCLIHGVNNPSIHTMRI